MPAEFASHAPGMQPEPESWRDYFPSLSFEPHAGQRETYELATEDPAVDKLIVLPTGYGKTLAAAGYYAIARQRGIVSRCLWVVSSDLQREGLSPAPDKKTGIRPGPTVSDEITKLFGLACLETFTVTGADREIRAHRANLGEIFVTSYQFLREQATYFRALMETGDWMVIGDEAHHLSSRGAWARWLEEKIQRVGTLYMSATPLRTDRLPLKNVPVSDDRLTFKARVHVPAMDAIQEHVIRDPRAHAQEWELEFTDKAGKLVTYTTTQLRDLDVKEGDDFDAWVVKHDLKYTMVHLQRIILDAVNRLNEKRATLPGPPHQMLVYAMGCAHAKFLASQVFPSIGYEREKDVDWIGVTRSAIENDNVIKKYKAGELLALVQVSKAGEGFDYKPASVGLFLNMIKSETTLIQMLGRIMRRIFEIKWELDVADVFAETTHPVLDLVRSMEPKPDENFRQPGEETGPGDGGADWPPLPALMDIEARWLKTDVYGPGGAVMAPPGVLQAARKFGMTPEHVQEVVRTATGQEVQPPPELGEVGRRAMLESKVTGAMALISGHAISLAQDNGITNHKQLAGWVKINLNYRWVQQTRLSHKQMLSDDFARKYEWLREIHEGMRLAKEVPSWLLAPR